MMTVVRKLAILVLIANISTACFGDDNDEINSDPKSIIRISPAFDIYDWIQHLLEEFYGSNFPSQEQCDEDEIEIEVACDPESAVPCPDNRFCCKGYDFTERCRGLKPASPENNAEDWECAVVEDRHECRGYSEPSDPGNWYCTSEGEEVVCVENAYYPDDEDRTHGMECFYEDTVELICIYGSSHEHCHEDETEFDVACDPESSSPCPDNRFCCSSDGTTERCRGFKPASPEHNEEDWECEVVGNWHECRGYSEPSDPGNWYCTYEWDEVVCLENAYFPDNEISVEDQECFYEDNVELICISTEL